MQHAVIMAGGSGTRLWPLSRQRRPKQLMRLFGGDSLLQLAWHRLKGVFDPGNIWIITSAQYIEQVAKALPDIPRENLIGEPVGRDTANAIGLAAHLLARRDPDGTMAVFTADHLITPQDEFARAIRAGLEAAERFPESLITFGITPAGPQTGYGYIHRGPEVSPGIYRVLAFKEKPTRDIAQQYVASGDYYWNSGMFVWPVPTILKELERRLPENSRTLSGLAAGWGKMPGDVASAAFAALTKISIDFAVMEHAAHVLVVEMNCRWLDVGSWEAVGHTQTPDNSGNMLLASRTLLADSGSNILVSEDDHLLAALGVHDLVIVHSEDATLICHRDYVEAIRELAAIRQQQFGGTYE
jgi:mannose-1-phosphate guanylyltransferase